MIELTQAQLQALEKPEATPPRGMNPHTREMFVLMPLDEYERLIADESDDSPSTDEERDLHRSEACQMLDSFGKDE